MTNQIELRKNGNEIALLRYLISDKNTAIHLLPLLDHELFINKKVSKYIFDYIKIYNDVPSPSQINSVIKYEEDFDVMPGMDEKHTQDWFKKDFEKYVKYRAIWRSVLNASESIDEIYKSDNQDYSSIKDYIQKALNMRLSPPLGIDFFGDLDKVISGIRNDNSKVSTGFKDLDTALHGGFNRGELNIFAGASGSGKSLFLLNLAINWIEQGLNVIYFSLELSSELCALRISSMMTNSSTKLILADHTLSEGVSRKFNEYGKLQITHLNTKSTVSDIRAFVNEYERQFDIKVDAILVDYIDLMGSSIKSDNKFETDKDIVEDLRDAVADMNLLLATASQYNRQQKQGEELFMTNIAGGLSKANTCDNLVAIYDTPPDEHDTVTTKKIKLLKTRSSSGVGRNITFKYNNSSMRISDHDPTSYIPVKDTAEDIVKAVQNKESDADRMKRMMMKKGD